MNSRSRELSLLQINPDGQVLLQEEAATFLRALEGPLSIMAIVGPRHSGKSFLMNQIIGEKEAFNVCHGFDSPSKGLWVWTKPLLARDEQGKVTNIITIDSSGFQQKDASPARQILTLTLLISSLLIYNSQGPIDSQSLKELQCLIQLCRSLMPNHPKSPDFHWVLRDFDLGIKDFGRPISTGQYLENCLLEAERRGQYATVETVKQYFPNRKCHCLVSPNFSSDGQERPEFVQQIIELRKIMTGIRSISFNGAWLVNLLEAYVSVMNKGGNANDLFLQGNDCLARLNCLHKLKKELRLRQGDSRDWEEEELEMQIIKPYKVNMHSKDQLKILEEELKACLQSFTPEADMNVGRIEKRDTRKQKAVKPLRLTPVSLVAEIQAKVVNERVPKGILAKIEEYEGKMCRLQLQLQSSYSEIEQLKREKHELWLQNEKWQEQYSHEMESKQTALAELKSKEAEFEELSSSIQRSHRIKISELQKNELLAQQKIIFLDKQLLQTIGTHQKELQRREKKFQIHLGDLSKELIELKYNHEEEIAQVKEIYRAKILQQREILPECGDSFYKDFRQQVDCINHLKQQNEQLRFKNSDIQNTIRCQKAKIQTAEEKQSEILEQATKRARDYQKNLLELHEEQLRSKDNQIMELSIKVNQLIGVESTPALQVHLEDKQRVIQELLLINSNLQEVTRQLRHDIDTTKFNYRQLQGQLIDQKKQIGILKQSQARLKATNESFISESRLAKRQYEQMTVSLSNRIQEREELIKELKNSLQLQRKERRNELAQCREEILENDRKHCSEVDQLLQKIQNLSRSVEAEGRVRVEFRQIQQKYASLNREFQQLSREQTNVREDNQRSWQQLKSQNNMLREANKQLQEQIEQDRKRLQTKYRDQLSEIRMQMDAEIDKRERQAEQLINKDAELYLLREECEKIQKESRAAQQQLRAKLAEATRNITEVKSQHQKQLERLKAQANYLEAEICQEKNNSLLEKTKNQLLELKTAKAVSEATAARAELFKYITAEQKRRVSTSELMKKLQQSQNDNRNLMSNLEDLQQREKSSAIKHQNHLNLFEAQISSLKNTITELKQQNENYHLKSHAAMESAKLINNNYNKDYELFTRRLAQSIATEKDDLSA